MFIKKDFDFKENEAGEWLWGLRFMSPVDFFDFLKLWIIFEIILKRILFQENSNVSCAVK